MASYGLNKVSLIGNIAHEPTYQVFPNVPDVGVTKIVVATSEYWTDKAGVQQTRTEWHKVVIFGPLAKIAHKISKKGTKVYIEGQLQTRFWINSEGLQKNVTEIVVNARGIFQVLSNGNFETTNNSKYDESNDLNQLHEFNSQYDSTQINNVKESNYQYKSTQINNMNESTPQYDSTQINNVNESTPQYDSTQINNVNESTPQYDSTQINNVNESDPQYDPTQINDVKESEI